MTETLQHTKDKLMDDLHQSIADAEEMLKLTANEASESTVKLRERVRDRMSKARVELQHLQQATVEKAKAAGQATDVFVHENPWKSIGIAAGMGLVVGLLISRR
ncbi:YqjD family protein [Rhodoferax sp.]|uniref:DUF883 family protein n=1 Tax=Rhodoferax sp. TaxID=50421 RepID=UPI0019F21B8F|nr:DUF883 family protein [Rhodoferax sp.]MBE0473975.1 DUF883 domain-containing protein [Rhodoferax sp.]